MTNLLKSVLAALCIVSIPMTATGAEPTEEQCAALVAMASGYADAELILSNAARDSMDELLAALRADQPTNLAKGVYDRFKVGIERFDTIPSRMGMSALSDICMR